MRGCQKYARRRGGEEYIERRSPPPSPVSAGSRFGASRQTTNLAPRGCAKVGFRRRRGQVQARCGSDAHSTVFNQSPNILYVIESLATAVNGDDPPGTGGGGVEIVQSEVDRDSASAWIETVLTRIQDPVASLSPTAQRVLAGAMRVVVTKGFGKLTLASISAASGENVAAVKYYFGNKAGLISVLVDAVVYDELVLLTRPPRKTSAATGLSRVAQETLILSSPSKPLKVLFELLPHALRDKKLRLQLQGYYETFYELHLAQLGAGEGADPEVRARLSGLASLLAAASDGLTMQALVAPQHFDFIAALRALDALLACGIPALISGEADRS